MAAEYGTHWATMKRNVALYILLLYWRMATLFESRCN